MGNKVCSIVLDFLNGDVFDNAFNYTYIVLISKSKNPSKASDFKPNSLCNVIYKLASKILVNGLKLIMSSIFSNNQNAFLPCRLIADNIIVVAYEVLQSMKTKFQGKTEHMAVKLDILKAFD